MCRASALNKPGAFLSLKISHVKKITITGQCDELEGYLIMICYSKE